MIKKKQRREGTAIISIPYPTILSSHSSQFSSIMSIPSHFSFVLFPLFGIVREITGKGKEMTLETGKEQPFYYYPSRTQVSFVYNLFLSLQISSLYLLSLNVGKGTVYRQVLSDKEKVGKGNECERRMMRANPFLPSPLLFSFPPFKRVGRKCMGKRMRVTWLALSRPFSSICLFFLYLFFILKSFPPVVKANKRSLFIST